MNIQQQSMLQEDSPEREDTVYKLATAKMSESSEWQPIRLELLNTGQNSFILAGADAYSLTVEDDVVSGRGRPIKVLNIVDKFQNFVDHPDYAGLIKVVPATQHNLVLLARHVPSQWWKIHESDIDAKVQKLYKEFEEARSADPNKGSAQKAEGAQTLPGPIGKEPGTTDSATLTDDDMRVAKERVYSRHAVEIERMKAQGQKRIDLTREFKAWLEEELASSVVAGV